MIIRRKFVWLMILMVWVGMVTSIIVYQGDQPMPLVPVTGDQPQIGDNQESDYFDGVKIGREEDLDFLESQAAENGDFFVDYRLERNKVRSEQINNYREMINNPNHSDAAKRQAEERLLELTERMEKEMEIESLIKGRGYEDALAFIHDNTVDIIIKTTGLTENEVATIGDIIIKTTGFSAGDLTIIEKKKTK